MSVRQMPDTPASQPDFFVGWWEIVFHIRDGEQTDVTDIIEHVDAAGSFTVFRDCERIGAGHHVDFTVDPDGFTNVLEDAQDSHSVELFDPSFSVTVLLIAPLLSSPPPYKDNSRSSMAFVGGGAGVPDSW